MREKLAIVVTGATGKQGGAVVKCLLERGHEVRAVTRRTDSAKARELANAGVKLVRASLEDTAALTKALADAAQAPPRGRAQVWTSGLSAPSERVREPEGAAEGRGQRGCGSPAPGLQTRSAAPTRAQLERYGEIEEAGTC